MAAAKKITITWGEEAEAYLQQLLRHLSTDNRSYTIKMALKEACKTMVEQETTCPRTSDS